jgi:hypothetical protein
VIGLRRTSLEYPGPDQARTGTISRLGAQPGSACSPQFGREKTPAVPVGSARLIRPMPGGSDHRIAEHTFVADMPCEPGVPFIAAAGVRSGVDGEAGGGGPEGSGDEVTAPWSSLRAL